MQPKIISKTIQEYNDQRFYLCGNYFQRDGLRLHIQVWEDVHGERHSGCHIHHKDHDKTNNHIDNLVQLSHKEHMAEHPHNRPVSENALKAAAEWHKSDEGSEWHKKQYEKYKHILQAKIHDVTCKQCNKEYKTAQQNRAAFCSKKCKAQHRRLSGVDNETRTCPICGTEHIKNKYARTKTCGRKCGTVLTNRTKTE